MTLNHTLLDVLSDIEFRYPHGLPETRFNQIWDEIGTACHEQGWSFALVRDLLLQYPSVIWDNKRLTYHHGRFWLYLNGDKQASWYSFGGAIWIPYLGAPPYATQRYCAEWREKAESLGVYA